MLANVMEHIRVAIGSQPNLPKPNLPNLAEGGLNLRRDGVVILRGVLPPQDVRRTAALCDAAFTGLTTASDPSAYANAAAWGGMSLDEMLGCMAEPEALSAIVDRLTALLPDAVLSPHATYGQLVKRNVEKIPVSALLERIVAVQLVPYPPGIPIMMPGEKVTRAVVDYLLALQHFDSRFPGFEHDTHGIEVERDRDGKAIYMTRCLKA